MSPLLRLPAELLDLIMRHLIHDHETEHLCDDDFDFDYYMIQATRYPFWYRHLLIADLRSVRLTCRHLSMLDSVNSPLFHTFFLYIHSSSLANLHELAKHRTLRHHVRKLVFMPPQFYERYREAESYVDLISGERVNVRGRANKDDEDVAAAFRHACAAGIMIDRPKCHSAYVRGLSEQETLLKSGQYSTAVSASMMQLPNLRSVRLSDSNGRWNSRCTCHVRPDEQDLSFAERHYPEALVRPLTRSRSDTNSPAFAVEILDVVARSGVRLREITLMDGYAFEPTSDLRRMLEPVDWSNLKKVDLSFDRDLDDDDYERWSEAAWWRGMRDFLSQARGSVEELRLRIHRSSRTPRDASKLVSADGILGADFPKLHTLSLRCFSFSPLSVEDLDQRMKRLKHLILQVHGPSLAWRILLKRLRERQCKGPGLDLKTIWLQGAMFSDGQHGGVIDSGIEVEVTDGKVKVIENTDGEGVREADEDELSWYVVGRAQW